MLLVGVDASEEIFERMCGYERASVRWGKGG